MIVRVGADVTGLNRGMKQANSTLTGFASKLNKTLSGIQGKILAGMAGIGGGLIVQGAVEDAMKYESLMTTLGESLGNSRKQFEDWSATTGRSMGFSRLQSAELANTLSLNFKKIATSQEDLTNKTTKMMEIAGVIANKRGLTMEEVSDRIRSAMNQEADGADELGVNVRIAAIKTSDAYKQMADGKPWDQLSQNMQKTILYEHIIQQVTENLGATMQDTTQLRMGMFIASLYDVKLALGQAFLPILYAVLPYLTKMMDYLYKALTYVSAFTKALFGGGFKFNPKAQEAQVKATQAQTQAVGDLGKAQEKTAKKTKKAQKETKRGVAGFDEVNLLAESGGAGAGAGAGAGGAGGAGAGGDVPVPEAPPMPLKGFTEEVDKLVGKMKKMFAPIIAPLKSAWDAIAGFVKKTMSGIADWWAKNQDQILKAVHNVWKFMKPIVKFIVKFVWDSIKGLVEGIIQFFEGVIEFFTGVFTGDWGKAWEGVKDMFFGAFKAIMNFLNLSVIGGIKKIFLSIAESGVKAFLSLVTKSKASWEGMWTGVKTTATTYLDDAWKAIKGKFTDWTTALYVISDDILKAIVSKLKDIGGWFKTNVTDKFVSLMGGIKDSIAGKASDIWTAIKGKFGKAYEWFRDNVVKAPYNAFIRWKNGIAGKASEIWEAIKSKFSGAYSWFKDKFVKPIKDLLGGVKDIFKNIITGNFKGAINVVLKGVNTFIRALNKIKSKIPYVKNLRDIDTVPYLAKGGIATSATLAMVGEGSQPEAIAPIDKLQGYITNAVLSALRFQGGGGGGTSGDIVLNLDGRTFARIIKPHMDKEAQRIGGNVKFNPI